jgi:uncharacterized protein (DUF1501 family)
MQQSKHHLARRHFLQQLSAVSGCSVVTPLALNLASMANASAQTANDYKALVCIFMLGGNDAYNTVLATNSASWASYQSVRNQSGSGVALPANQLLGIGPLTRQAGRSFALHPSLVSVQNLFQTRKRLAIVANVGALVEPVSKSQYMARSKTLPSKLFSHNDQQNTWQALGPEGRAIGWGGLLADQYSNLNNRSLFAAVSAAGNAVWLSGKDTHPYQVSAKGTVRYGTTLNGQSQSVVYNSPEAGAALERIAKGQYKALGSVFAKDLTDIASRSISAESALLRALPDPTGDAYGGATALLYQPLGGGGTVVNPLAQQLQMVARMIGGRQALGLKRQVFFVTLPGFDTHDKQLTRQADLLARLDHGLAYFDGAMEALGVSQQVTTFTASDFGRTFTCNGDGTDHGWGSHHFVMGGAVNGGDIYGRFPDLAGKNTTNNQFDGSDDLLPNGVLLPQYAVEQYAASLGRWMGLSSSQISTIFPRLSNFGNQPYIGFL